MFIGTYYQPFIFKVRYFIVAHGGDRRRARQTADICSVDIRTARQPEKPPRRKQKGTRGEREYRKCFYK